MLTLSKFVNDFDRVVQQSILQAGLKLAKGACKSHEQYNREVGRVEGMEAAVNLAREMLRKVELDEDEAGLPEMQQDDGTKRGKRR